MSRVCVCAHDAILEKIYPLIDVVDAVEAATVSPRALAKQLQLGNTATLERRIRRELEDIGSSKNACCNLMCPVVAILAYFSDMN